jgi:23S rRNA pseudouridine1911/1915/1917 synthase
LNDRFRFEVGPEESGQRIDTLLAGHHVAISRSLARRLIDEGKVLVNNHVTKASHRVSLGDGVRVELDLPPSLSVDPEEIGLDIVYFDHDMAVIDKPAGMVVHPGAGHSGGTLANALLARFPEVAGVGPSQRPGIVHRLDKDTSGLMVVALSALGHRSLQQQIASHHATRTYLALVSGRLGALSGTIDAPIGRDPKDRKRMTTYGVSARSAQTTFRVLETAPDFTLVQAILMTGRTHQIRVHFAAIGHPVAGDMLYHGRPLPSLHRQFLHSHELDVCSPSTGAELHFSSELPPDLQPVLRNFRNFSAAEL